MLRFAALVALLLLSLAGCSSSSALKSGSAKAVTATQSLPPPDTTAASGAYVGVSDYRVGPLDLLEVSVFQVPDLNRTVRINTSGQISLPLIGAIRAGGKTVTELEAEIAAKLSAQFLQNPQVSVFVKEFSSQRITVEGAVKNPGIFPITGKTSLLQVIAMARGFEELAREGGVSVPRNPLLAAIARELGIGEQIGRGLALVARATSTPADGRVELRATPRDVLVMIPSRWQRLRAAQELS